MFVRWYRRSGQKTPCDHDKDGDERGEAESEDLRAFLAHQAAIEVKLDLHRARNARVVLRPNS